MARATESLTTRGGERCPVCDESTSVRAQLSDYNLFCCSSCRCWSSDALFRGAEVSFETSDYFGNSDLDRGKWEDLFRGFEREAKPITSVLDVGCGNGAFLSFVGEVLPDCHREGIEIDPGRAEESRGRNPGARIHEGSAEQALGAATGPFDLITLWDVFEHVEAPSALLEQLASRLAPGGVIHIVTINEQSLMPLIGRLSYSLSAGRMTYPVRRTHEPHHLVFFTSKGLELAADRAGLRVRKLWFDRLLRGRMDGNSLVTAVTSSLLWLENVLGNGLFFNVILEAKR